MTRLVLNSLFPRLTAGSLFAVGCLGRCLRSGWTRSTLSVAASCALGGCAVAIESGPPIANPADVAARLTSGEPLGAPAVLRFEWKYADRRGDVGGQGVARYNPPDSLRVDLFTSGDVALAVALAGGELRSLGEIEDVEIPDLPFVYAMAGIFEPGGASPEAFVAGADSVLVYATGPDMRTYFFVRDGRLHRVEERRKGRTVQRVNLRWGAGGVWPATAEYRNLSERNRVRWDMGEVTPQVESHPAHIYDLPPAP